MGTASPLLRCYEELERICKEMLQACEKQNWDAMTELQQVYCAQVEVLRVARDLPRELSAEERALRHRKLERILSYDAAIRKILVPEWERLSDLLGTARRRLDLGHTYRHPF
jgi:flagellar protein FliT